MIEILLVEDNLGDVRLIREAPEIGWLQAQLERGPGWRGGHILSPAAGEFSTAVRPDLILFDLNLPRKDGPEVLAEVKADEDLKLIPIVVLTTSEAEEDVLMAYRLHANCYITKPVDLDKFMKW